MRAIHRCSLIIALTLTLLLGAVPIRLTLTPVIQIVHAQPASVSGSVRPSKYWGLFVGSRGDVEVDVTRPGIAARLEIPREFLSGVVSGENDTHFVQSDIRNDYYYYSLVDEAHHWTYGRAGNASDGPCYKPNFSIYDSNAPWCLEIWNYLNGTFHNFTASPTAPKVIRLIQLNAPSIAGVYNFTLSIANRTNSIGYPDFAGGWITTLQVPVSLSDNPASVSGIICDIDDPSHTCQTIYGKGVVYATNVNSGQIARAYVNPATGRFNLTGLSPGAYSIRGSAGVTNGIAYSLSDPVQVLGVQRGLVESMGQLQLHRAPRACGTIGYYSGSSPLPRSLSTHPYLSILGFKLLNITVEASDPQGHIFRNQTLSSDSGSDSFELLTGMGVKYVGSDPYGTEFAGLPSVSSGAYVLTVRVWISGYLQGYPVTVTISSMPGSSTPIQCIPPDQGNPIVMNAGGVISGTIRFQNLQGDETPLAGTTAVGLGLTKNVFGGNLVVEALDHTGVLRGVTVMAWNKDWEDATNIPFYVFGFSEYYNRTWAGSWDLKDYGLPSDSGYSLTVLMRGYEQNVTTPSSISLGQGGNSTVSVRMIRGGLIQVTVGSYDNRPGSLAIQARQPWRFFNLSIPIRERVYFYDPLGSIVGFEERSLRGNESGVTQFSVTVTFTGQNYSLREIWFYGLLPTHITNENYTIKAFTLGYIQPRIPSVQDELTGIALSFIPLFIANEVDVIVPVFSNPGLLGSIPEHSHSLALVYDTTFGSVLSGALTDNVTAGRRTLDFPCFGFGAALYNGTFNGQGHFFYVNSGGTRYYDYGLNANIQLGTTYTSQLPEFGFRTHFMQINPSPSVTFTDLYLEKGTFINTMQMASIIQGTPLSAVQGYISGISAPPFVIPLTWVTVQASNSSTYRYTSTVDGAYDGVEALFIPAGNYSITFSISFYYSQTVTSFFVGWGGVYSLLPPLGYLCPTAGSPYCTPPSSPSPGLAITQNALTMTVGSLPDSELEELGLVNFNHTLAF